MQREKKMTEQKLCWKCREWLNGRHEYLVDIRTQLKPEIEDEISIGLVCACGARARAYYKLREVVEGEI